MDYKKTLRAIHSNRKHTIPQQIYVVKQTLSAGEYKDALKLYPVYYKHIHKSPIFETLSDVYIKETFFFTRDFKKEFKWLCNIIEEHLPKINLFIDFKNKYESSFIQGDYINAKSFLNDIESQFGVSLWTIEANLLIEEHQNSSEANWNKLSTYLKEIKNSIYEFLISTISKRIEVKLSYENFLSQFQNDLDNTNANGFLKDFFVFKSIPCADYEYEFKNLESVLYVSNILSIIDQYQILIDVINYNIARTSDYDKLFFSFVKLYYRLI